MTLRKTTIDNSVGYIPESEQYKEKDSNSKTTKAGTLSRKQIKKII